MTDLPPAQPPGAQPGLSDEFRSLRRSRSERVVAGVLGGLGQRLGIDPVVLRVATVVLAIFGGVGVLVYAAAWLLVPAEDEDGSVLDQALGRAERRSAGTVPLAIVLTIVTTAAAFGIIAGSWDAAVLLVLAAAGVIALLRRRDDDPEAAATYHSPVAPEHAAAPAPDERSADEKAPGRALEQGTAQVPEQVAGQAAAPAADHRAPIPDQVQAAWFDPPRSAPDTDASGRDAAPAQAPTAGWPEGPDWTVPNDTDPLPEPEPPAPTAPKTRSILGVATFCAALVAVGILAVNDVYWATVPPGMYIAVALGVVAVGLLIGAWFGRSRGLIALGILLALALVPATMLAQWDFSNSGDASYVYTTPAQLPPEPVSHGAGDFDYDLSDLQLADGQSVPLTVEMGAGDLTITLPDNADVSVNASVATGNMDILGEGRAGFGQDYAIEDFGPDGPGGGTIELTVDLGLGNLVVTR